MSMPHQCECRICGRSMEPFGMFQVSMNPMPFDAARPGMGWVCTKHGLIPGSECEKCEAEQQTVGAQHGD